MNNVIDIDTYTPLESDNFFFDTNIWIYLFCPIGNYKKKVIKKYDGFLKRACQSKSSVFISALVLSEFFNTWLRLDFNIKKSEYPSRYSDFKKDFRNTKLYEDQALSIKTVVRKQIMRIAQRIDDKFATISIDDIFKEIEISDFNDNYFLVMANLEKFKIVTDDHDFVFSRAITVPILTANQKMLKRA